MLERGLTFDAEQHPRRPNLHHLLQDRLPQLGLDAEMYGPYVWGDEDETDSDDDMDGDEMKELVLGVLQASSETHAEDDDVWMELIDDIQKANKLDSQHRRERREKHVRETKSKMEEDLARAKLEEQEQVVDNNEEKKKSSQVDEETKRILMQRYGYDKIEEDEDQGSGFGGNSGGASSKKSSATAATATTNRDVAKAACMEKSREMRNASKTTKAEERKKTKDQRASKVQLKEDRRNRAKKGERKA